MSILGNAQIIGGVAVTIGADTSKLRAGEVEAKRIAAAIDKTTATVKIKFDIPRLILPPMPTLRIPVVFEYRGGGSLPGGMRALPGGGMRMLGGGGGEEIMEGSYTVRKPLLLTDQRTGFNGQGYDFGGAGAGRFDSVGTSGPGFFSRMASRVGGAASSLSGKLDGLTSLDSRTFEKMIKMGIAAKIVGAGSQFLADASDPSIGARGALNNTVTGFDNTFLFGSGQNLLKFQRNVASSTGWKTGGDYLVDAINWGRGTSVGRALGFNKNGAIMTADDEEQFARDQKTSDARMLRIGARGARDAGFQRLADATNANNATIGMTPQQAAAYEASQRLSDFDAANVGPLSGYARNARAALLRSSAIANRQLGADNAYGLTMGSLEARGIERGGSLALMRATGMGSLAGRSEIVGDTQDQLGSLQAELGQLNASGSQDWVKKASLSKKIDAITVAAKKKLQAFDIELGREIGNFTANSAVEVQALGLEAGGNTFGAGRARLIGNYDSQIRDARAAYGASDPRVGALYVQKAAAVGAMDTEHGRGVTNQELSLQSEANVAKLRIAKQYNQAELAIYDEAGRQRIEAVRGQEKEVVDATKNAVAEGRKALVAQQQTAEAIFGISMKTRRGVAGANGAGESMLAGVLGFIGGLKQELAGTDASHRGELIQTQRAEIIGLRNQILRPNTYAFEGDRLRDMPGGPGGESGREVASAISELAKALSELANRPGGLPN